jgi:hypothetical protein
VISLEKYKRKLIDEHNIKLHQIGVELLRYIPQNLSECSMPRVTCTLSRLEELRLWHENVTYVLRGKYESPTNVLIDIRYLKNVSDRLGRADELFSKNTKHCIEIGICSHVIQLHEHYDKLETFIAFTLALYEKRTAAFLYCHSVLDIALVIMNNNYASLFGDELVGLCSKIAKVREAAPEFTSVMDLFVVTRSEEALYANLIYLYYKLNYVEQQFSVADMQCAIYAMRVRHNLVPHDEGCEFIKLIANLHITIFLKVVENLFVIDSLEDILQEQEDVVKKIKQQCKQRYRGGRDVISTVLRLKWSHKDLTIYHNQSAYPVKFAYFPGQTDFFGRDIATRAARVSMNQLPKPLPSNAILHEDVQTDGHGGTVITSMLCYIGAGGTRRMVKQIISMNEETGERTIKYQQADNLKDLLTSTEAAAIEEANKPKKLTNTKAIKKPEDLREPAESAESAEPSRAHDELI